MRVKNALRNIIVSVFAQAVVLILSFISRKVFISFLNIEYLGFDSLFSTVFSVLSMAEMGMGSIISYHLYKEIAANNLEEISKLMYIYKWIYRIIVGVVLFGGVLAYFFLPLIVNETTLPWDQIHAAYLIQLFAIISSYIFLYARTIFVAYQKEYYCSIVTVIGKTFTIALQITALVLWKNYFIFLAITVAGDLIVGIILLRRAYKEYPFISNIFKVTRDDIKKRNIVSDAMNFFAHSVGYSCYSLADSFVISIFLGIRPLALYGNYMLMRNSITNVLLNRMIAPIQASIGNFVHSNEAPDKHQQLFDMFDMFSFIYATFMASGFIVLFQPTIKVWLGETYILPFSFVVLLSLTFYLMAVTEIIYKYRCAFGDYRKDRNMMLLSALVNVAISVALVRKWGLTGVQFGTLVAFLPMAYGRFRIVVGDYLKRSVSRYCLKQAVLALLAFIECSAAYYITRDFPTTVLGILIRALFCLLFTPGINLLIFYRKPALKDLYGYIGGAIGILKEHLRFYKNEDAS
jgi:O-antigen/teichoic acid export membrane protein